MGIRRATDRDQVFQNEAVVKKFFNALEAIDPEVQKRLMDVISPHADAISGIFYTEVMSLPETQPFLSLEEVDRNLHQSLAQWIRELFQQRDEQATINYIERQFVVGNVHARINVPMHLVNQGLRIVKRECFRIFIQHAGQCGDVAAHLLAISEFIDLSADIIHQSYLNDVLVNERNAQAMRMQATEQNVALECEHLRASLFDWLRRAITALYSCNKERIGQVPPVDHSDFGLWVLYKAHLYFYDHLEAVDNLKSQLVKLGQAQENAAKICLEPHPVNLDEAVSTLNEEASETAWLISSLVNYALQLDMGRDPLTRLFNRRYVTSVLQRAVKMHLEQGITFSLLLFDLDHFKRVNDTYGHESGDAVLSQFARILLANLRSTDFVFRWGGEEFLVFLAGVGAESAQLVADKLRRAVDEHAFSIHDKKTVHVSASCGVAVHDGHPDYSRTISLADEALYQAKKKGRNRVILLDS